MTKVICVNNNKGGVLKTTTTTNLAGVIASEGKKVLIVDMDMQSNVSYSFGISPKHLETTIFDVLYSGIDAREAIITVHENIDILPSNSEMTFFEFKIINELAMIPLHKQNNVQYDKRFEKPYDLLSNALESIKSDYDVILIDTPPSVSITVMASLTAADGVIVPYVPEFYSMAALNEIVEIILEVKRSYNPNLEFYGILRTIVKTNLSLHGDINHETERFCIDNDLKLFGTIIPQTIQFANAVAYHKKPATLMLEEKEKRKFGKAVLYKELWEELKPILDLSYSEV